MKAALLLNHIQAVQPQLSPAEQRVAQIVLERPGFAVHSTLAQLAEAAEVSEPTVMRFCRTAGQESFRTFKVALAQALAAGVPFSAEDVKAEEAPADIATKVIGATIGTLTQVQTQLDPQALEAATGAILRARRLEFYGLAASGIVALDAHHKFFRLKAQCAAYTDSHMQVMSASTMEPDDVVVAISHTGRTRELIESAHTALEAGAQVIAVTRSGTPLAHLASILLPVNLPEDTDLYTPMTSRIAHLVLLDALAVSVAAHSSDDLEQRLSRIKASLRIKRQEEETP